MPAFPMVLCPLLAELERNPHARQPRVELEVRPEHRRQGLGFQHQVLPACVQSLERGDVAGDVLCRGVHAAAARGWDLAVGDRVQAAGAEHVPGGEAGADALGADEVGVVHPQRFEDALARVILERLAG